MKTGQLTHKELVELTGAEKPSKQIEVLEANRIRYVKRLNGAPATTWEAVNSVLAPTSIHDPQLTDNDGFNLDALNNGPKAA